MADNKNFIDTKNIHRLLLAFQEELNLEFTQVNTEQLPPKIDNDNRECINKNIQN